MIKLDIIKGDFYLPDIDLWLDPQVKQKYAFISHAHMDHVKNHDIAICSEPTRYFLKTRSKIKKIQTHQYLIPFKIDEYKLTLYPAGHILGSAMLLIEYKNDSLLFTGDVKVNESYSSEKIVIPKAKSLIIEASFGSDKFIFPKKKNISELVNEAISNINTPVFFSYTLGKSQEVLAILNHIKVDKPIYIHENIKRLNKAYEKFGILLPKTKPFPFSFDPNGIYILPVHLRHHKLFTGKQIHVIYTTGWALDKSKLETMQCDIALPISDHAGFDELLNIVEKVSPEKIICHHGRPDFANYLKEKGFKVSHIDENIYNEG